MRVSVTVELTDMRQKNESFHAGIEEELAQLQRQAAEAQARCVSSWHTWYTKPDILRCNLAGSAALLERY
eukprot:468115-Prymnesium_polylepis.1